MTPTPKTNAETVAEFVKRCGTGRIQPMANGESWADTLLTKDSLDYLLAALEAKDREREAAVRATWEKAYHLVGKFNVVRDLGLRDEPEDFANADRAVNTLWEKIRDAARADGHDLAPEEK